MEDSLFALHVKDDSFEDAHIKQGDIIIMKRVEYPSIKDLLVIENKLLKKACIRRVQGIERVQGIDRFNLHVRTENEQLFSIEILASEEVNILGKVHMVIRQMGQ